MASLKVSPWTSTASPRALRRGTSRGKRARTSSRLASPRRARKKRKASTPSTPPLPCTAPGRRRGEGPSATANFTSTRTTSSGRPSTKRFRRSWRMSGSLAVMTRKRTPCMAPLCPALHQSGEEAAEVVQGLLPREVLEGGLQEGEALGLEALGLRLGPGQGPRGEEPFQKPTYLRLGLRLPGQGEEGEGPGSFLGRGLLQEAEEDQGALALVEVPGPLLPVGLPLPGSRRRPRSGRPSPA